MSSVDCILLSSKICTCYPRWSSMILRWVHRGHQHTARQNREPTVRVLMRARVVSVHSLLPPPVGFVLVVWSSVCGSTWGCRGSALGSVLRSAAFTFLILPRFFTSTTVPRHGWVHGARARRREAEGDIRCRPAAKIDYQREG